MCDVEFSHLCSLDSDIFGVLVGEGLAVLRGGAINEI